MARVIQLSWKHCLKAWRAPPLWKPRRLPSSRLATMVIPTNCRRCLTVWLPPHPSRKWRRRLLPLASLMGAVLLAAADILARWLIAPQELPVGVLTELVRSDVYEWGSLMAGALIGSLPVVILYSFFVEYYVSSMTGAVKE